MYPLFSFFFSVITASRVLYICPGNAEGAISFLGYFFSTSLESSPQICYLVHIFAQDGARYPTVYQRFLVAFTVSIHIFVF